MTRLPKYGEYSQSAICLSQTARRRFITAILAVATPSLGVATGALFPERGLVRIVFVDVDTPGARDAFVRYQQWCWRLLPDQAKSISFEFHPTQFIAENPQKNVNLVVSLIIRSAPQLVVATNALVARAFATQNAVFPVLFHTSQSLQADRVERPSLSGQANMTGFMSNVVLNAKRLELLRDLVPAATTVGVLQDLYYDIENEPWRQMEALAWQFALKIVPIPAADVSALRQALRKKHTGVDAWLVPRITAMIYEAKRVCEMLNGTGKPAIYAASRMVREGGLTSYEAQIEEAVEVFARQTAAILAGTPVNRIPIEHPKRFRLAINLATADSLGIRVPMNLLRRADLIVSGGK